ncbi:uncharacterized protein BDW43DRAFT_240126 [Aspergillus alliaceus]|uniref:uncharacterized protein n=1 Tax=Petromyces alliaceus TaxID=209559 RepID=UPI0012A40F3E|nr:uncharacterized protein BDW43DRAFT_240126 [Aspergillus alliaceus]KAB8236509.1 hypothetical protein BDW43DRAFT_240126 [Aspergillus alliaceus]
MMGRVGGKGIVLVELGSEFNFHVFFPSSHCFVAIFLKIVTSYLFSLQLGFLFPYHGFSVVGFLPVLVLFFMYYSVTHFCLRYPVKIPKRGNGVNFFFKQRMGHGTLIVNYVWLRLSSIELMSCIVYPIRCKSCLRNPYTRTFQTHYAHGYLATVTKTRKAGHLSLTEIGGNQIEEKKKTEENDGYPARTMPALVTMQNSC